MKLAIRTLLTSLLGVIFLAIPIFVPAGTLAYWQGWLFIGVFTVATNALGIYLVLKDPVLLERRKKAGPFAETRGAQKVITWLIIISLVAMLVVSALDYRFGWSQVPPAISVIGAALVVLGLFMNLLIFRANSYVAATVETMEGQKVISTGPYGLVRHPMYASVLVMLLGVPIALGSWWGLLFIAVQSPILMWRILDEESLLNKDLPGYVEYTRKVRYRLVPYLW